MAQPQFDSAQGPPINITHSAPDGTTSLRTAGTVDLLWTVTEAVEYELQQPGHFKDHAIAVTDLQAPPSSIYLKTEDGDVLECSQLPPGSVLARSEHVLTEARWKNVRLTMVTISRELMERALPEPFTKSPIELHSAPADGPDHVLNHLIGAIGEEIESDLAAGELFFEHLGNTVALYAATCYGLRPPRVPTYRSGLSRQRLTSVIEYIDHRLGADLTVHELAGVAHLSPYHFSRMFRVSMGESVHRYVLGRRLERATRLLREGDLTLAQVAIAVGFSNQSHFTTAFGRHCGTHQQLTGNRPADHQDDSGRVFRAA